MYPNNAATSWPKPGTLGQEVAEATEEVLEAFPSHLTSLPQTPRP